MNAHQIDLRFKAAVLIVSAHIGHGLLSESTTVPSFMVQPAYHSHKLQDDSP
jgi:hypothetical protein